MRVSSKFRTGVLGLAIAVLSAFSLGTSLTAQVRRATPIFRSQATAASTGIFTRGGLFTFSGGVVLHGNVRLFLERSAQKTPVDVSDLRLITDRTKGVWVAYGGSFYKLEIHRNLACPLSKFVLRDGEVAYTMPLAPFLALQVPGRNTRAATAIALKELTTRMSAAGLVADQNDETVWVAKEFARSRFVDLLEAADVNSKAVPVSPDLAGRISASINSKVGALSDSVGDEGTYVNTDAQTVYESFLIDGKGRTETSGVPLRLHWTPTAGGAARIAKVERLSQDWAEGQGLVDFRMANAQATQYDVISFFQNAAVFRTIKIANAASFEQFSNAVCVQ